MKTLKNKILLLTSLSVAITTILVSVVGIIFFSILVDENSERIMNKSCDVEMQEINHWFQSIEQSVDTLYHFCYEGLSKNVDSLADKKYLEEYVQEISPVFRSEIQNIDYAMNVYYRFCSDILPENLGFLITKEQNGRLNQVDLSTVTFAEAHSWEREHWWYIPIEKKQPTWINPYYDNKLQAEIISYVVPIIVENVPIGVIGMDIDFSDVKKIINNFSLYKNGNAILVGDNGHVFVSETYKDYVTEPSMMEVFSKIALHTTKDNTLIYTYTLLDKNMLFTSRKLKNNMILAIAVPKNEIYKSRNYLVLQCLLVIIFGILVSILVAKAISKKMTKSLTMLTRSAEEVAKGNYNVDIDTETNANDEIGVLAKTFKQAILEIEKNNIQINKLAYMDSLTGAKNRHCFNRFTTNLEGLKQKNVGIIFCDLNGLKYVNDNFGHGAGDKMICDFVSILKKLFGSDEYFRLSGDEFVIYTLGKSKIDFFATLKELRYYNNKREMPFASIGSIWVENTDNMNELLKRAEKEMYLEKRMIHKKFPNYTR